ncbi:MAG: PD-(D/E)XK nuclease family protein [Pirellulales bacterium]
MLLFYETITRAERRLWLSFPALNDKAEPLLPSPYLAELARICKHELHGQAHISDLRPIPPPDALLNIFDARIRAAAAAGEAPQADVAELAAVVRASGDAGMNLMTGLGVVDARSRRGEFGPYEGMIIGDDSRRMLDQKFHTGFPWSAGQLEEYGFCPHKFFLSRVLKLEPAAEVGLEVDYFKRGSRTHDVLAELHGRINEQLREAGLPSELAEVEYERLVEQTVAKYLAKENVATLDEAFRAIDEKLLRRWLSKYREQHDKYDKTHGGDVDLPRPTHFEKSFGMPVREGDRVSKSEPLELKLDDESVRITGRIDRIDVGMAAGRAVFTIVDYKTGRAAGYSKDAVTSGRVLQLTLYAMAAQQLILRDEQAVPWQFGYWFIADSGFKKTLLLHQVEENLLKATDDWNTLRDDIIARVIALVRGIRSGQFPMHSADEHCTSLCEFNTVCRVAQVRSLEKTWQPPPARR